MTTLRPIALQLRLDAARSLKKSTVLSGVILPLAICLAASILTNPSFAYGFSVVIFSVESLAICLTAPIAEGVNDHKNMNGVLPINRTHQVLGRYLYALAFILYAIAGIAISWLFVRYAPKGSWDAPLGVPCTLGGLFTLLSFLVTLPILYACNPEKVTQAFSIVLIVICGGAGALSSALPDSWTGRLPSVLMWASDHPWATAGIAILACALLTYISITISIHLLKRRQY